MHKSGIVSYGHTVRKCRKLSFHMTVSPRQALLKFSNNASKSSGNKAILYIRQKSPVRAASVVFTTANDATNNLSASLHSVKTQLDVEVSNN